MTERLTGLSVFVEAVEAGGFSAAAARLNLSRSAVGKTVARLEASLGARLFHRTTRSQSLTEDGQVFYEHCLRALEEIRAGEAMLERGRREVSGRLRVAVPVLFGRRCVVPILAALARRHPRLELDIGFSDRLVDLLEDGYDLAIRNGPLGDWPGLMAKRIGQQRMVVCAAPGYLEAHGAPHSLEEIPHHDAIAYARSGRVKPWCFPVPGAADIEILPRARLRFDDLEAIADAAVAGMGLAWLPCWLVRDRVRSGQLVPVLKDVPATVFPTHAVWPQSPQLPLRVRAAIDTLAEGLPGAIEL
ncbi:MAG TPA: LysR family transcriptional regulator [Azospirillum sp.]|nr:LysR family transcriptional regulator [Azospirillum sp.]